MTTTNNVLEISIHPHHHIPYNKKQSTLDSGYHSTDELSYTSSPTTSIESRRSSFSSFSSYTNSNRQSLLPIPQRYTTLKSAHERIEFLEEQIKNRRQSNEMVVKGMNFQIDSFLKNMNSDPLSCSGTDSSLDPIIDVLNELKSLVTQHDITVKQEPAKIIFSTQIIDNWIQCTTQHKSKQDLQNVSSIKYQKIVKDIQILSKEHTLLKKKLKKSIRLEDKLNQEIKKNKIINEDKIEIEQLLDEIRNEMENMMEELNHIKLEKDTYFEKSKRLEIDLNEIIKGDEKDKDGLALQALLRELELQIDQLEENEEENVSKIESLKVQLKKAERSIAELSLLVEVQKRQKISNEMEQALRRSLAEKDGELAKIKFQLEKNLLQNDQIKIQQEKQMKIELNTHLQAIEDTLKNNYKKETEIYLLNVSRKVRESAGKMVELEIELEDYHRQHEQDINQLNTFQQKLKLLQSNLDVSKKSNLDLESKIKVLESEVLLLYGKNLELAQHLGELDE